MYGLGDDLRSLVSAIHNVRSDLKKVFKAIENNNSYLAIEYLRQADQHAIDGLNMWGDEEDSLGVDGVTKVKPCWVGENSDEG